MKTKAIEAVQNCIDVKRELNDGISSFQIRAIVDGFNLHLNDELAWRVQQHFSKKYGI